MNINSSMVCRLKSTAFFDVNGKTGGRTPLIVSNIDNLVSRKSNIETKNYPLVGDTKSISDFSTIENSESSRYLQKNECVRKYNFNHDNYKYKLNGGGDGLLRSILSITSQNPYWITGSVGCKTNGDGLSSHLSENSIKIIKLRFRNSLLKIISGPDLEKIIPKERLNAIREPQAYKVFERVLFNKSLAIFDLSLKGAVRIMSDMLSINLDKELISSNSFKEIECRYEADFCSQFGINIYFDVNSSSKIMTDSIIKDDNGDYSFIVLKNHYAKSKEEYITVVDKLLNPIRGNLKEYCSYIWGDNKESEASDNKDMSNELVMRTAPKRSKRRSMRSEKWNGLKSDKINKKLWKDMAGHSNNEQSSGTEPWLRHFDYSEMMPRNYLFGKEDAKSAFLELFFGFSKDVELCSSFDNSFELGKIAQSVKHSIYKSSPTNNEGVNEINKHSTGEIVEKNKRIKKMIEETREEKERHGCNWICFPSAESSEISEPSDYVTPEEYEQNLHREKRRAPGNAKPENYLNLDVEKVYSGESNLEFLELKDILSRRVGNDIQSQEDHTWDVVKEINRLRRRGSNVDQFLRDALDLYVMRRLDTDPEVGTAYSYFQHRTREELVNHGRLYVDSDLENFTMGSLQRMHHDPETGVSNRIDFLTAKMFIAQANGESIHPQHLGLALGDISIYRQIMKHNLEQRYENKINTLFSELENSRSSSRVMANVDNALGQTNVKTSYKPVLASYTDLASQATPITYKAQGYCHYYAVSAALAMSENDFQDIIGHARKEIIAQNPEDPRIKDPQNVGRLSTVLDRTGDLKAIAEGGDPAGIHRFLVGITSVSESLQSQVSEKLKVHKKRISVGKISDVVKNAKEPVVFTMRHADGSGNGHTISISKVYTHSRSDHKRIITSFLVADANLGAIPCPTLESAMEVVKVSANRYIGADVDNNDFRSIKVSSLELNADVKKIFGDSSAYTVVNRSPGTTDELFTFKQFLSGDGPSLRTFDQAHGASRSSAWANILTPEVGTQKVVGDTSISGDLSYVRPMDEDYRNKIELITKAKVKCTQGTCSLDIDAYRQDQKTVIKRPLPGGEQRQDVIKTQDDLIYARLEFSDNPSDRVTGFKHSEYSRVDIGSEGIDYDNEAKVVPPRNPRGDEIPVLDINRKEVRANTRDTNSESGMQEVVKRPQKMAELENSLRALKANTESSVSSATQAKIVKPKVPLQETGARERGKPIPVRPPKVDQVPDNNAGPGAVAPKVPDKSLKPKPVVPPVPDKSLKPKPATPDRSLKPKLETTLAESVAIKTAGLTLEAGAAAEGSDVIRRAGAIRRSPMRPKRPEGVVISEEMARQIRERPEMGLQELGRELLEEQKGKLPAQDYEYGDERPEKIAPVERAGKTEQSSIVNSEAFERVLFALEESSDPELIRTSLQRFESTEIEVHRTQSLTQSIQHEVNKALVDSGHNPREWQAIPSRTSGADGITFEYIGQEHQSRKTITVEMPEYIRSRFNTVRNNWMDFASKVESYDLKNRFIAKMSSPKAQFAGKVMGLYGKAMSTYALYTLASQLKDLEHMGPSAKLAFGLSAADAVGDAFANVVGGANFAYKLTHGGAAIPGLQSVSRSASKFSMGLGVATGIGISITHIYSLSTAETSAEYDLAATNLGFSTAGTVVSVIGMAVPFAAPFAFFAGIVLAVAQNLVLKEKIEAVLNEQAVKTLDKRFEGTEKILEIIDFIGRSEPEDIFIDDVDGNNKKVVIQCSAAAAKIIIESDRFTLIQKTDAYSIMYERSVSAGLINQEPKIIYTVNGEEKGSIEIPVEYLSYAINSHGHFPDGRASKIESQSNFLSVSYKVLKHATDNLIPCLFLGNVREKHSEKNLDQKRGIYDKDLKSYLKKVVEFKSSGSSEIKNKIGSEPELFIEEKQIILDSTYPKITLVSDSTNYAEDERQQRVFISKPAARNLGNCAMPGETVDNRYTQRTKSACSVIANEFEYLQSTDICNASPQYQWNTKSTTALIPDVPDKEGKKGDKKRHLPSGTVPWISDRGNIYKHDRRSVSTPVESVLLEPPGTSYRIDFDKGDPSVVNILPEKYSSDLLAGKMEYFSLGDERSKSTIIRIDERSKANFNNKLLDYNIDLIANGDSKFNIFLGTVTNINENKPDNEEKSGDYYFSFHSTYTENDKQVKVQNLKTMISTSESDEGTKFKEIGELGEQREIADQAIDYYEAQRASRRASLSSQYRRQMIDKKYEAFNERNWCIREINRRYDEIDQLRHSRAYMNRLFKIEEQFGVYDTKELKIKISSEINNGKREFYLTVNPEETSQFGQAKIKISDMARNVNLHHVESIVYGGSVFNVKCLFKIDLTENKLDLLSVQNLPYDNQSKSKEILEALLKQLKSNNSQFTCGDNLMIGSLDLSSVDKNYLGDPKGDVVITSDASKRSKRNTQPQLHEQFNGYSLFYKNVSGSTELVAVIYDKNISDQDKLILQRLQLIDYQLIKSRESVPLEYRTLFDSLDEENRKVYFLYDEESKTLVKQYMGAAIRWTSKEDVETCSEGSSPLKYSRGNDLDPVFSCLGPDTMDLNAEIEACRREGLTCDNIFDYILTKQNKMDVHRSVSLLNAGLRIPDSERMSPVLMELSGGESPSMLMVSKNSPNEICNIVNKDFDNGFALVVKDVVESSDEVNAKLSQINTDRAELNLPPLNEIKLFAIPLIMGEELTQLGRALSTIDINNAGIPAELIKAPVSVASSSILTTIRKGPGSGFTLETLDGVAFTLAADFSRSYLMAASGSYLESNHVNISSSQEVTNSYESLCEKYGFPDSAYIRMSDGGLRGNTTEPMIYIDTSSRKPLFIPRTENNSYRNYLLGSLEVDNSIALVTTLDPETQNIITVRDPLSLSSTHENSVLSYSYASIQNDKGFFSLRSNEHQKINEDFKLLAYLPLNQIVFLPVILNEASSADSVILHIDSLMQQQLKSITLAGSRNLNERTQRLVINGSPDHALVALTHGTGNDRILTLVISKNIMGFTGTTVSYLNTNSAAKDQQLLRVDLYGIYDSDENLLSNFDGVVNVNNKLLDHHALKDLSDKAKRI